MCVYYLKKIWFKIFYRILRRVWNGPNIGSSNIRHLPDHLYEYYQKKFSVHPKNIIVISDDINLRIGNVRVRSSGGDGGHNGIKSAIRSLGTEDFPRIRIGIGTPKDKRDQINYVLSKIPPDQKCFLDNGIKHSVKAVELIIYSGIETAMNKTNGK